MNKELEIRNINTELRKVDESSRKVTGLAIPVESRSELLSGLFYETIDRAAINDELIKSMDVKLYVNHDSSQGTYARSKFGEGSLRLFITPRGLEFETDLPNTAWGDQLLEGIRRGDYDSISFAFIPETDEWAENEDGTYERTIRSIGFLDEISILSQLPAYSSTDVKIRSLEDFKEQKRLEEEQRKNTILLKLDEKLKELENI